MQWHYFLIPQCLQGNLYNMTLANFCLLQSLSEAPVLPKVYNFPVIVGILHCSCFPPNFSLRLESPFHTTDLLNLAPASGATFSVMLSRHSSTLPPLSTCQEKTGGPPLGPVSATPTMLLY